MFIAWASFYETMTKHLNEHAFKTKRLTDWFSPEIRINQKLRDNNKRADYRKYSNKTRHLIRTAKRKY